MSCFANKYPLFGMPFIRQAGSWLNEFVAEFGAVLLQPYQANEFTCGFHEWCYIYIIHIII